MILVPTTFRAENGVRKLEGLCGDFDGNSRNEFLGYDSVQAFGNHWKDRDPCPDIHHWKYKPCEVRDVVPY